MIETLHLIDPNFMMLNGRLEFLFKDDGVIGGPLSGIQNLQYIENEDIKNRVCYIEFNALV